MARPVLGLTAYLDMSFIIGVSEKSPGLQSSPGASFWMRTGANGIQNNLSGAQNKHPGLLHIKYVYVLGLAQAPAIPVTRFTRAYDE